MTTPATRRLFVALPLPEEVLQNIRRLQDEIRRHFPKARFTRPEGIHLTLFFLGATAEERLPSVVDALRSPGGGLAPFTLRAGGLGVFPSPRRARVLWLGVGGEGGAMENLHLLEGRVREALASLGFPPENRDFSPHLTLARFRFSPHPGALEEALAAFADRRAGEWLCARMNLYESLLRPGGAEYRVLETFSWDGNA
jgi:2'-5' RNA ligase